MDVMLGDRELDVMGVLWDLGSASVAEVRERLPVPLAYTTVLTILRNLEAKGVVRHTAAGRAFRYHPRVARAVAQRGMLERLIGKLFGGSPELLLTHLVDDHPLSGKELRRLRRRLKRRLDDEDAR